MKRDMDLVRKIILKAEAGDNYFETTSDETAAMIHSAPTGVSQKDADALQYHLLLLHEANYLVCERYGSGWHVERLTWSGHDFADSVRDDEIWSKTKAGAEAAGVWTFDLVKSLAKGFIKKQIEDRTGIALDI